MSGAQKQWVVRDKKGRIYGPFSTDKVLTYIEKGFFSGGEEISRYPGGEWYSISREPEFYDKLLEALETASPQSLPPPPPPPAQDPTARAAKPPTSAFIETLTPSSRVIRETVELEDEPAPPPSRPEPAQQSKPKAPKRKAPPKKKSVWEPVQSFIENARELAQEYVRYALLALVGLGVVLAIAYVLAPSSVRHHGRIHLIAPRTQRPAISNEAAQTLVREAIQEFQKDTFEGYISAEDKLVKALEGSPRNLDAFTFLCLTYRELWPYSHQDTLDTMIVNSLTQTAIALDPITYKGMACKVSQLMTAGHLAQAQGITDNVLQEFSRSEIFYQFKAEILAARDDLPSAVLYLRKVRELAPGWAKPVFLEARYQLQAAKAADRATEKENIDAAESLLRSVLKISPDHALAKIELARIKFKYSQSLDEALKLINGALDSRLTSIEESIAHALEARIYMQKKQNKKALKAAEACYTLSSSNIECRELIVQLGGFEKFSKMHVKDNEALFLGDQYARSGDCFAAQAEYKAAFDNDRSNAIAAFKAGRCLWQLSYSKEAIEWLQKAIKADPQLTDAYILIADYSAQRYNYEMAFASLNRIQRMRPKDYKVYHGYAVVEFRRQNYKVAIKYDERALDLYKADVDVYVLLAKSYLAMRELDKAMSYVTRAIELDLNNVEAQCTYAKVLAQTNGADVGLEWVRTLASESSTVLEFQVTMAEILLEAERFDDAKDLLERLSRLGERKDVLLLLGQVYQRLGNAMGARQTYLTAATLDSSDAEALFRLGLIYLSANQNQDALKQFNRVLEINPRFPQAHIYRGRTLLALGQTEEAQQEAQKEKRQNPYLAEAYMLSAEVFEKLSQYNECAGEYQKALKLRPGDSNVYVRLAKCYRQSGSPDIALSMLKLAVKIESGNADIYKEQGALYDMKGDKEAASTAYQKYLDLAPTAPDRAEISARMGR